ncbi:MAG: cbb3-type cytochrome c oxidase subunit I [Thermomicrobiales bacterium]|nr:cbb3-type cytochrome c oxidase subunit I [Thermomicrobiales bacterium]MCO5225634.1 cbb3-type cytochrome c oxidase subunit I [Thermomicrobiales bacterium]MCO5228427.1 cbb3-type cytochrome c oxidase subunit I [Thermomicrobiales bacterium]
MSTFQRTLIGIALTFAPAAMGVAIFLAGYSQTHPAWWQASVHLAVLGGITIMIYGVNFNALPVHSGKPWRSEGLLALQLASAMLGAIICAWGYGHRLESWLMIGHLLAFAGAVLFQVNLVLLFTQPGERPPRIPWDQRTQQQKVDRMAIPFTMVSSLVLMLATGLDLALDFWTPEQGRWDLVWAHLMLLGFFFPMASGTSYHILGRWAERDFRSLRLIRVQQISFLIGLPTMAIALGWDLDWLFLIGGPLMAVAMGCWAINLLPVAWRMSPAVRFGIVMAMIFMIVGVTLGVIFAIDPALGARLRTTHVMANLFGFAGLLMSGFGYRYVPHLAGQSDVRWPLLQAPQLILMVGGCAAGMVTMGLRMYGHIEPEIVMWATAPAALGMMLFAINAAATFMRSPQQTTA